MSNLSDYFTERNIMTGIIIFVVSTFVIYLLTIQFFGGYFFYADLQFLVGAILSVFFSLKFKGVSQSNIKCGLITGIAGGIITALFLTLFETLVLIPYIGFVLQVTAAFLFNFCLTGIVIGLLIGAILTIYFNYKETVKKEKIEYKDDKVYKDLVED